MASNVNPGQIPVLSLLQGSQAASSVVKAASVEAVPAGPVPAVTKAAQAVASRTADSQSAQSIVDSLNKHLNDTGRPTQFRVDPNSGDKLIQEVNPANGEVVGEFSVEQFPALARSIGASGLLVDHMA
jgi:hypothetical protein